MVGCRGIGRIIGCHCYISVLSNNMKNIYINYYYKKKNNSGSK